jgi:hypothetical protein
MENLSTHMEAQHGATDSYDSILQAFNADGQLPNTTVSNVELIQRLSSLEPERILRGSGILSTTLLQRLEQREDLINDINELYASDYVRYLAYHVEWLYLMLSSRERHYVEEFAQKHLGISAELLPACEVGHDPPREAIQACFRAHEEALPFTEVGSRYFYKRYRSLLLAKLQASMPPGAAQTERLRREGTLLLESWSDREADVLVYLVELAPPELRDLFPHAVAQQIDPEFPVQHALPHETDRRLWQHIVLGAQDTAAANTLVRLSLLEHAEIYRPLPAEVLLEFAQNFIRIKLAPQETIVWEGEHNSDVFILLEGELEALVGGNGQQTRIETIRAGEVFGEMAFFTREPRTATVRATQASECFVLKDADLRLLAYQHPSTVMQMAGVLARRLADKSRRLAGTHGIAQPVPKP